jgi:sugar O-acyltransferase (sialic acid O-acetyltransferase NeuD family)
MTPIVIYGASGHAKVVIDAIRRAGDYHVVALVADGVPDGSEFEGIPIRGGRECLSALHHEGCSHGFVAVGDPRARLTLSELLIGSGFQLPSIVHPNAVLAEGVRIGEGVFVAAGAVINAGSVIGNMVIVNTRASVDHDASIERLVHLAPGSTLAGHVTVKEGAWVGIGATVLDRRVVGEWSIVGAGAVVTRDVAPHTKVMGVPARYAGRAG